jgi:hypothetical protein
MTWTQVADLVAVIACLWLAFAVIAVVWICRRRR